MKPSVYIETTIPSFYHETRASAQVVAWRDATREWWNKHRDRYELFTSQGVRSELARAPARKAKAASDLIAGLPLLDEPPRLFDVVRYYIEHRLLPAQAGGDAYHLAMASLHQMNFLLTWNCLHLANSNKIQHIRVVNKRLGLAVPVITTPMNLFPEVA